MRKKDVRTANLLMLNSMVKPSHINNVSVAINASKLLFGKRHTIESIADSTGLGCGSPKAITYDNYAKCQDTANQRLHASKTIGLINRLQNNIIAKILNILFMMQHASIKMVALSTL